MDTIAQMLTIIRNASAAKLEKVDMPASKMRENVAKILVNEGFARSYKIARDSKQGIMRVYLKYNETGEPGFINLEKVSTPGRRVYVQATEIPVVRSGTGQAIISTSKGIMTGKDAKTNHLGGELLCLVW
ncbi:30S ribosomal protein S8 [Pseudobdellovibrio exovorus]|uniref:Small ribosomal subunit protein uS8 n=1 Tax=Pseudobdellovibrio exovorus JSS TaxID=1184267 RepID=M4VSE0_9BACT|nr:30S ribosomal protein S8 [Pseudobdellovibrio exovorus]AGH96114.1 30S ribosomal protein S8 [Pseudobdellovibrio exovorus JSS]